MFVLGEQDMLKLFRSSMILPRYRMKNFYKPSGKNTTPQPETDRDQT